MEAIRLAKNDTQFSIDMLRELSRARGRYPDIVSRHEGWAIIHEELDELWDLVRERDPHGPTMYKELIQVAAMCTRMASDLNLKEATNDSP